MKNYIVALSLFMLSFPAFALSQLSCKWTIGDSRVPTNNGSKQIPLGAGLPEAMDLFVIGANSYHVSAVTYQGLPGIELMSGQKNGDGSWLLNTVTFLLGQGQLRVLDNPKGLVVNCAVK